MFANSRQQVQEQNYQKFVGKLMKMQRNANRYYAQKYEIEYNGSH